MHRLKTLIVNAVLIQALVISAFAAAPVRETHQIQFDDIDPCTGTVHTVTIDFQDLIRETNGRTVDTSHLTASTSPTGYTGHGDQIFVVNSQMNNYTIHAVLTNDAGHQIVITRVFILDLSTNRVVSDQVSFACVR